MRRPHPRSTLFPYTTLFRSCGADHLRLRGTRPRAAVLGSPGQADRKSTRLNSSHVAISYAVFCLKKKRMNLESHCAGTGIEHVAARDAGAAIVTKRTHQVAY